MIQPSTATYSHLTTGSKNERINCLNALLSGDVSLKHHCRLMNDYATGSKGRNKPRKKIESLSQYYRPPKTRVRKVSYKERQMIERLKSIADWVLQGLPTGVTLSTDCEDSLGKVSDSSSLDRLCDFNPATGHEFDSSEATLNIPYGDASIPSR